MSYVSKPQGQLTLDLIREAVEQIRRNGDAPPPQLLPETDAAFRENRWPKPSVPSE